MIPTITKEELFAELDKLRGGRLPQFTKEQYEYIHYARSKSVPVTWNNLRIFFKKQFDINIHPKTLLWRYSEWLSKNS